MDGERPQQQHLDQHLEPTTSLNQNQHNQALSSDDQVIPYSTSTTASAQHIPSSTIPTHSSPRTRSRKNTLYQSTPAESSAASSSTGARRRSARFSRAAEAEIEAPSASSTGKGKKKTQTAGAPSSDPPLIDTEATAPTTADRKGKKRALPPPSPPPAEAPIIEETKSKKARYSLRSTGPEEVEAPGEATSPAKVDKGKGKAKSTGGKGKKKASMSSKKITPKNKKGGSSTNEKAKKGDASAMSLLDDHMDEDEAWVDEPGPSRGLGDDEPMDDSDHDDDDEDHSDDEPDPFRLPGGSGAAGGSAENPFQRFARLGGAGGLQFDEAAAEALFGSAGFGGFGGLMSGLSNRFKRLRSDLRAKSATKRLNALRECSELLLVSNEDTLGGAFSTTAFATEFIAILKGTPNIDDKSGGAADADEEMDEDAQLAAALAMSTGGMMVDGFASEEEMECQLLACRCLAHLMEALPGTGHTLVTLGAVPALCSKLQEIAYIELAEQTLSTMEKISAEYPAAIVREGGLSALLNYLPFFSTNVQRTAVTAAANCCRNISGDHYNMIKEVFPILRDTLTQGDQRLVEQATLAVVRTIEAYRHNPSHLEGLLDVPTVVAVNALLMPSGGSPLLSPSTYTHLLKALTTSARGSATVSIAFLEAGMTNTIYQILTGVLPPAHDEDEQGESAGRQGLAGGIADMAVLQNLAHRPKDQIEEALALICELLPPTPKDGIFDPKGYTEKALAKVKKGRRSERPDRPRRSSRHEGNSANSTGPSTPVPGTAALPDVVVGTSSLLDASARAKKLAEAQVEQRMEMLRTRPHLLAKFIRAMVPILVDVYAASVASRVRTKALNGLLKALATASSEELRIVLQAVPMASFLGAIISAKEMPYFTQSALQLVEVLVTKLPDVYQTSFLREGVVFEIERLAEQELSTAKAPEEPAVAVKTEPDATPAPAAGPSNSAAAPSVPITPVEQLVDVKPILPSSLPVIGGSSLLDTPTGALGTRKTSSSAPVDPNDANILRARVIVAKKVFDVMGEHKQAATSVLDDLTSLISRLCVPTATDGELRDALRAIADRFTAPDGQALSSFEILKSGLVDGFLEFVDIDGTVPSADRRSLLFEIFSTPSPAAAGGSAVAMLVKRLHESLGRLEDFEVETAWGGATDTSVTRYGSSLGRTMRIRLTAEPDGNIPKGVSAMTVTIQAIAPVQALHDYLRPRVQEGHIIPTTSGLTSMLAAYAGLPIPRGGAGAGAPGGSSTTAGGTGGAGASGAGGSNTTRLLNALAASAGARGLGAIGTGVPNLASSAPAASGSRPAPANLQDKKRTLFPGTVVWNKRPTDDAEPSSGGAGPSTTEDAGGAGAGSASQPSRRRSARLSAANTGSSEHLPADVPAGAGDAGVGAEEDQLPPSSDSAVPDPVPAPLSSSAPEPSLFPAMPMDMDFDDEDDYDEDDYEADVFEEEMEEELVRPQEKVVNMNIAPDGSRVEAKTPEGTRIATPNQAASASVGAAGPSGTTTPRTASYAGAVKTSPSDWHLSFKMEGLPVNLADTIYGAIHKNANIKMGAGGGAGGGGMGVNSIAMTYRKVEGPAPAKAPEEAASPASVVSTLPEGLNPTSPTSKILRLLRVIHNLTVDGREAGSRDDGIEENLFVNNKLTAKLTRQLEETMIIASNCLPDWAIELPKHFSFLFPFETRYAFLQNTSFGYGRLIARYQAAQQARASSANRRDDLSHLSRITRQKVRISRAQLLESTAKVLELYGASGGILEVEYFDEIGTGLGPTLEFFSLASKEFARRSLGLWRDEDESKEGDFVFHPRGLFPRPLGDGEAAATVSGSKLGWYRSLGIFVGRALLDSRIIDVNMNKVFLKMIQGRAIKKNIATLKMVDAGLARSLERLSAYLATRKEIEALKLPIATKRNKLASLTIGGAKLAELSLDFTLPGYDMPLKPGGAMIDVDDSNLEEYLELVLDMTLGSGISRQVKAFQDGFSQIFPISDLQIFSPEELGLLFGNAEEDWSRETLEQAIKADHGYNLDSRSVQNLIEVMSGYDKDARRQFLQFITGAPKLPIGGFRGLNPPFTVVRKPHEAPFRADDYLPSVMTCAQYLKLPDYSSKEVLASQIQRAMQDGGGSFHLS